ncbi:hypothetical protein BGZ92_003213 [Podila epicladia]|nr:hypothetical protein BGZ92_003213 [Podila epicladia]
MKSQFPELWCTFTTKQQTLCRMVVSEFLHQETSRDENLHENPKWGAGAVETMFNEVSEFKILRGKDGKKLTIDDLIDRTPKDRISKFTFEEKLFEVWSHVRAVLLGDFQLDTPKAFGQIKGASI